MTILEMQSMACDSVEIALRYKLENNHAYSCIVYPYLERLVDDSRVASDDYKPAVRIDIILRYPNGKAEQKCILALNDICKVPLQFSSRVLECIQDFWPQGLITA